MANIKGCSSTEHNFVKIGEEIRRRMGENWNFYNQKVYIVCCSKCGATKVIEGGVV